TCLELGAIADAVQLPAGVLNVVTGLGADAGAALTAHKGLDKIAFTGSSATGKLVLHAAAENLIPVTMELGGKSALLVFDDVDIDKAVEWAMFGCFWTNGQICSATSRLLLHERIAPAFLARLVQWAQAIRISDPLEPGCRLGPLVSEAQYHKVAAFIEGAKAEGAEVLCGGKRPQHLARGYYLEPTVLRVTPGMRVWQEEVFGPVLAVHTFSDEQHAIALANDSSYGLAAAVISGDQDRCRRVSEAMECGIVWVNCSQPCFCQAPWGGKKRSGFGRELGKWGLENYLSVKQVTQYVSSDPWNCPAPTFSRFSSHSLPLQVSPLLPLPFRALTSSAAPTARGEAPGDSDFPGVAQAGYSGEPDAEGEAVGEGEGEGDLTGSIPRVAPLPEDLTAAQVAALSAEGGEKAEKAEAEGAEGAEGGIPLPCFVSEGLEGEKRKGKKGSAGGVEVLSLADAIKRVKVGRPAASRRLVPCPATSRAPRSPLVQSCASRGSCLHCRTAASATAHLRSPPPLPASPSSLPSLPNFALPFPPFPPSPRALRVALVARVWRGGVRAAGGGEGEMVRGSAQLPRGTGKAVRVAVFAEGEEAEAAAAAGADVVGGADLIAEVKASGGKLSFDKCIATPALMPKLGQIARILGPRGLMPNPKMGTVTVHVGEAVRAAKRGKADFKTDKTANVHVGIGKVSFPDEALAENAAAFAAALLAAKPVGLKKSSRFFGYFTTFTLSSTMGKAFNPNRKLDGVIPRFITSLAPSSRLTVRATPSAIRPAMSGREPRRQRRPLDDEAVPFPDDDSASRRADSAPRPPLTQAGELQALAVGAAMTVGALWLMRSFDLF
ncbi:unnamed protein product, partial [Closterium sp. Naga37s-1]